MNNVWDERAGVYLTWREGFSPSLIKRNLIYTPILKKMVRRKLDVIKPKSLLEVGCGTGRLFSLYKGISATCIDSSVLMLDRASKNINGGSIVLERMDVCDPDFCNIFDRFFDMVVCSNVLLHISHDMIDTAVKNICSCAGNIVCVEWVEQDGVDVDGCYLHDYVYLFDKYGFGLKDSVRVPFEKQMLYHFVYGGT